MDKKKKILTAIVIIMAIVAVIAIVSYNHSMQSEYEVNDIAKEIFLSGQIVNQIDDINSMNLNDVEKWLNSKGIYPDGSVERLDYYEFYNTQTGEFIIVEKSTGDVSYSVHKDIIEQRAYLANPNTMKDVENKKVDSNNDGVIDEKDKSIKDTINEKYPQYDLNGNKHEL